MTDARAGLDWEQIGENPYLSGNMVPITEELTVERCEVIEGEIPRELDGTYMRNGSNQQFEPRGRYHLFDGDGMIHAVGLRDGVAGYRNRWILGKGLLYEREVGHAVWGGMQDVNPPDEEAMARVGRGKNMANIHVVRHAEKILALYEAGRPTELTAGLDTVGEYDFDGELRGAFTAHPHIDAHTGEMFGFAYRPMPPFLTYYKVDARGRLVLKEEIEVPAPVMMHDFMITEHHAVFLYAPAVWDVMHAIQHGGPAMTWRPENGAQFIVVPRDGGATDARWFEAELGWIFHFSNAFERKGEIVVDGCRADSVEDDVAAEDGGGPIARLNRYVIPLASGGEVRNEEVHDRNVEFPIVHPERVGRDYRHAYMLGTEMGLGRTRPDLMNHVVRFDFETGEEDVFSVADRGDVTEFTYAPNPESDREEDGWVMGFMHDRVEYTSELMILSAGDISAGPVARIRMPQRVPEGFHGSWMPGLKPGG